MERIANEIEEEAEAVENEISVLTLQRTAFLQTLTNPGEARRGSLDGEDDEDDDDEDIDDEGDDDGDDDDENADEMDGAQAPGTRRTGNNYSKFRNYHHCRNIKLFPYSKIDV